MATVDTDTEDEMPLYPVATVARRTGVAAVTLRAWERRYGFPRPTRTPGRQRLYSERDVQAITELQTHTARGVPISRAIALLVSGFDERPEPYGPLGDARDASGEAHAATASALDTRPEARAARPEALAARPSAHAANADALGATPYSAGRPLHYLRQRLVDACLAMDVSRSETALSAALSVLSVEDACLGVIGPALNEVGRRWNIGDASIAQEHFASAVVRARLAAMFVAYASDGESPGVLAACPPGEWHELGLLMVCLFLVRRGARVRYLGANLPIRDLADLAAGSRPGVVILSAQSEASAEQLVSALQAIERLGPPAPRCGYGGWVFNTNPRLRSRTPGTYLGKDAREATTRVQRLLRAPA